MPNNAQSKGEGRAVSEARQLAMKAAVAAVKAAVAAVKGVHESVRSAAKQFGIPRTTLQEHCSKL